MSIKLLWSTRVFIMTKPSIVTIMTIGSSCFRSMALKLRSVNVMTDIFLYMRVEVEFTVCTFLKCLFLTESEESPLANPPAMVLITPRTKVPHQPSLTLRRLGDLERLLLEEHCLRSSLNTKFEYVHTCLSWKQTTYHKPKSGLLRSPMWFT